MGKRLVLAFMAHLPEPLRSRMERHADLDQWLRRALEQAHHTWPDLSPSDESFTVYLAERVPPNLEPEAALKRVRIADLYLACACAQGDPAAHAALDGRFLVQVERAAERVEAPPQVIEETKQALRQWLYIEGNGQPPRITKYSGRGSLRTWLGVVGARMALKMMVDEGRSPEVPMEERLLQCLSHPAVDPELQYLKGGYRVELKESLSEAFAALDPRQRDLLRMHCQEQLNIDKIGAILGIHRSTAARRLTKTRQQLLMLMRRSLMRRLRIGKDTMNSILRLLDSQLPMVLQSVIEG